ncbi:hypothetical protein ACM66B_006597 [Microbotryomycetes sp. NB124-2]
MLREYKVVVMGAGGVGKSAITVQFVHSLFVEKYDPTVEDSYRRLVTVDNITVSLEIYDTAGTEQFMALHSMYMKSGDGFLLVFSLTNMESIAELKSIRDQINRIKEVPTGRRVPLVLIGNKCDLTSERQVPRDVAIRLSQQWGGVPYYETSARRQINIQDVFEDIIRQMIKAGAGGGAARSRDGPAGSERKRNKRMKCTIL